MSINRIKDNKGRPRWQFEFDRRLDGQRFRIRRCLPLGWNRTQADAFDREETAKLYARAAGIEKPNPLIEDALARYIAERIPELKHGAGTLKEIDLMEPYFRGKLLEKLPEVCAAYTKDYRDSLAPATIRNRLRYLTAACRYSWKRHGMGVADPGARVVMPAVSNERQVYATRAQMLRLARACDHWEARAVIRIGFYSGMRISEILNAEIDGGFFVLPNSKNGDPVRIPIHRKIRNLVRYEWPSRYIIAYHFRKARAAVGMDYLHFHDIRHSTASDLINSGVDLYTVGTVLRHKSHASTQRYAHLSTERVSNAIDKIGGKAA